MENKHELENLLSAAMPLSVYRGCIVSKIVGGYSIFGHKVKTPAEIDQIIESSKEFINKSIKIADD